LQLSQQGPLLQQAFAQQFLQPHLQSQFLQHLSSDTQPEATNKPTANNKIYKFFIVKLYIKS
jgi:hypothetical protein